MFKILIADDERVIRQGIIKILDRNIEEELVFIEARNGLEALELSQRKSPDLIITDIRMPGCSGLEFIQKLREINDSISIIILSGFEDFEYARAALRLGVKEYVTKPFKSGEFVELIRTYIHEIKCKTVRTKEITSRNIESKLMISRMRNEVLKALLLSNNSNDAKLLDEKLQDCGVLLQATLYICAAVQYEVKQGNKDYIDFAIQNILEEYLDTNCESDSIYIVPLEMGTTGIIFGGRDQLELREQLKELLVKVGKLFIEYYSLKVFTGLGDVVRDPYHLHQSMKHALIAADMKIYETIESMEDYDQIKDGPEYKPVEIEKLLKPLEEANPILVSNAFDRIITEPKSKNALTTIHRGYEQFSEIVYKRLEHLQYINPELLPKVKSFSSFWSFSDMKREIRDTLGKLQETGFLSNNEAVNTRLLNDILIYIQDHITEELDLNTVAEHFSRTPGYISSLFSKLTNSGFNSYITNERIKIAKRLLKDCTIPILKVGELCGYPNPKYFSVVFRKVTGETPTSYREKRI